MNVRLCLPSRIIIKSTDSVIDYVCAISIILIMPFFNFFNSLIIYGIKFLLGFIFLICVCKKDCELFKILFLVLLCGLIYTLYYLYNVRLAYGTGYASFFARSMLCWLYMSFSVYYAKYRANNNNNRLGQIYTAVLVITVIMSIIGITKYSYMVPNSETIMRVFGNGGKFTESERNTLNLNNIANWQLTYAFAFSTICYVKRYKRNKTFFNALIIILIIYFQIKAQITMALLFSLVPIVLSFVYNKYPKRRLLYISISIPVLFVFILYATPILEFIYESMLNFGQKKLAIRFYQIYESLIYI